MAGARQHETATRQEAGGAEPRNLPTDRPSAVSDNAAAQQILMTWRIRIIPTNIFVELRSRLKAEHSREGTKGKSQTAGQDVMCCGAFEN